MHYCERKQRELLQCWQLADGSYLVKDGDTLHEYSFRDFDRKFQLTTATPAEPGEYGCTVDAYKPTETAVVEEALRMRKQSPHHMGYEGSTGVTESFAMANHGRGPVVVERSRGGVTVIDPSK